MGLLSLRLDCVFFIIFLYMTGCVRLPEEQARCMLEEPPSLASIAEKAHSQRLFTEGDFPDPCWWQMFNDPALSTLIERALCDNPHLKAVQARVEVSVEEAKIQRSRLFPTIGANAQLDWEYLGKNNFFRAFTPVIPGNITEYELNLDLAYEFDFWGKNRNLYQAALGQQMSMIAEKHVADLLLATSVAAHYFTLQAYQQQLNVLEKQQEAFKQLFYLTNQRVDHALDTMQNQLNAGKQLLAIEQQVLVAKEKIALECHLINMLVGVGPEENEVGEGKTIPSLHSFPLPREISSQLIARRPDLIAQIWLVESTAHLVGAAKADFYPRVNLCTFAGLSSVFFSKLFTLGSRNANFEPALYLPIFTAGRLKARLRGREAQFREMIYHYNETVLQAVREVADQIIQLQTSEQILDQQNILVENRLLNRDLTRQRYDNALSNQLEVYTQELEVLQEQLVQIKLFYNKYMLAVGLIKALGGGYCNPKEVFDGT